MLRLNVYSALLSAVVLAVAGINTAKANVVVNGDFELASGTSQLGDSGTGGYTSLNNWIVGPGTAGNTFGFLYNSGTMDSSGSYSPSVGRVFKLHGPSSGSNNGLTGSADGGNVVALAAGASYRGNGISQVLTGLVPGDSYFVNFEWAVAQEQQASGTTSASVKVEVGSGFSQSTTTVILPSQGFSGWVLESFNFVATSTSESLRFLAEGSTDTNTTFALLDGISVTSTPPAPPAAVPEPGTVGLLACAIAGAVAFRLRRRALAKAI